MAIPAIPQSGEPMVAGLATVFRRVPWPPVRVKASHATEPDDAG
jgi:hypothetical protein